MRRSERGGRTCYAEFGFWYQPDGMIHMTMRGLPDRDGHVAVSNDPSKPYGHPKLYERLAAALRMLEAPAPGPAPEKNRREMVAEL